MNRIQAVLGCALALATAAAARGAEPGPPVLTLEEALSQALGQSRQVSAAALEVARAKDRVARAKASRLPSLKIDVLESRLLTSIDFEFEKGVFGTYPGTGPIPSQNTTISTDNKFTTLGVAQISQPISQLYKIDLGVKAKALGVEYAAEGARDTRRDIATSVRAAYYGALRAQASLDAAEEAERLASEMERLAGEAVAKETALEGELIDARAQHLRAQSDVLTLRDALTTEKELLNVYLARDVATDFRLADVPETLPKSPDLEASRRDAREHQPSVRRARLSAGMAELDARVARADYLPDVSLTVGYLSPWGVEFLPKNVVTAGVSLSWEVFDGGRRAKELAEKRKAADEARLKAKEAEELAVVQVAKDVRKVEETRRLLGAARLSTAAAKERLRVARNKYDTSAALLSDLLRAQTSLADASLKESEALLSYWTARADYEKSHGEDL
jgi:outer membrane protein TolC